MEHPHVPLQRSLALSLGVHLLIFGTALAFAHYGEALFGSGSRVITVDLVGGTGGRQAAVPGQRAREVSPLPTGSPVMPDPDAAMGPAVIQEAGDGGGSSQGPAGPAAGEGEGDPGTSVSSGPGGPAGLLSPEQWRVLQAAIDRAKSYPRLARERGIEGTVLVRFRVLPSGGVEQVNIVKSSGAAILDEASVKTVRNAGPMPYVGGWIEVPMVYELTK